MDSLYKSKQKTLDEFLSFIQPRDRLCASIAAGQPRTLLQFLENRKDWEDLKIFTGLCSYPYTVLTYPNVHLISGYYGPVERSMNEMGAGVSYIPLAFTAFENYAKKFDARVFMTTVSPMDEEGYFSLGTNSEAIFIPLLEAASDPNKKVILEVNPHMPRVLGLDGFGHNRIHISQIDAWVETDTPLLEPPSTEGTEVERRIAQNVVSLIRSRDTLQFGIGGIPNQVAQLLSEGNLGDFGVHSELISDGFLTLLNSGKITNEHKGMHESISLFTFALGSGSLYRFLDERLGQNRGRVRAAPVSYVNNASIISKNQNMVSINSGFMIDFSGQVCSEAIGEKQYSGVGGQLNFVDGAFYSEGGRSILCVKSCVEIAGKLHSNIVDTFTLGAIVSTPRHAIQFVVTEYGVAELYGLTDEERPYALVEIAHPHFRDSLLDAAKKRDREYYKSFRSL